MQEATIEQLYSAFLKSGQKICTDTRKLIKDSIFFCLKGANFNANEFAAQAIEGGCAFAVVDEEKYASGSNTFLVKDVLKALQQLANHHRKQLNLKILAITGSNGKTTNKELIDDPIANCLTCKAGLFTHRQPSKFYGSCSDGQM